MPPVKKSSPEAEALGRSRGGWTTKLHAVCDALGNPIRFLLSPGQEANITQAPLLLKGIEAQAVIADKGYDADWFIEAVQAEGATVVIPPKRNRKVAREYDRNLYADLGKVERMFNRLGMAPRALGYLINVGLAPIKESSIVQDACPHVIDIEIRLTLGARAVAHGLGCQRSR